MHSDTRIALDLLNAIERGDPKAAEYATHTLHLDKGTLVEQVRNAA